MTREQALRFLDSLEQCRRFTLLAGLITIFALFALGFVYNVTAVRADEKLIPLLWGISTLSFVIFIISFIILQMSFPDAERITQTALREYTEKLPKEPEQKEAQ